MMHERDIEAALHAVEVEKIGQRLVELACDATRSRHGAVFLYDPKTRGLAVDFHMVEGVIVALPGSGSVLRPRHDGRPNGIAVTSFERARSYLCNDTASDPNYARYFLDVASVAAVPILWQRKPIGVLTVSAPRPHAFTEADVRALERVAAASARFLRRAQQGRPARSDNRPFVIKGLSSEWRDVDRRIEQVSATDAPVLVQGESGTGKDLVSRAIHFNSKRSAKPFVVVNCAAIPETLLESVLFGHVKGAFTGASYTKVGEFQKADGGTLFLDELGELPMGLQAKVLRAIEYGEVTPLGSNDAPERVDVRLICATHRNLAKLARENRFREDLYYRISVLTIEVPALRTYKDNLPILAQVFLQQAAERHQRPVTRISDEAMALLRAYDFPGNVRELKNVLEHAVIMAPGEEVGVEALPKTLRPAEGGEATVAESTPSPAQPQTLARMRKAWLRPLERAYLVSLLDQTGGRVRPAAKRAGVNPVTFYRLMASHGIKLKRSVDA